jgi:O-antigen/teichoic acid export membrane protein
MIVSILGVPQILEGGGSTALVVWVAGGAAGGLVSMLWTRLSSARLALFWWRTEARSYGLELARAGVLYTIGTSGVFLLVGATAGPAILGSIRAALILLGPVSMLTTALGMAILPRLVENPSREDRRHLVRVQLWPPLILLGGLALVRPWLDRVLFGAESMYSASMFFVLSVAVAAQVLAASGLLTLRAERLGNSITSAHLMLVVGIVPIGLLASKADGLGAAVGMMGQWVLVAWSIHATRSRTDY